MSMRVHNNYRVLLAFLALGAVAGCDSNRDTPVGPSALTAATTGTTFRFEPETLRPEFVPGTSCVAAFGTRIIVIVDGDGTLRELRFRFTDRFGVSALPRVVAIPGPSPLSTPASAIPSSVPIPLPSSSPIPIPGLAPLPTNSPIPIPGSTAFGASVPAGTSVHLPFFLFFECGVASEGTLFIGTEVADPGGTVQTSQFRVRVGS
jgi:hypothetical protein